jgi:PAS domain S-box-containing protein
MREGTEKERREIADGQLRKQVAELQAINDVLRTSEERYHKMVEEVQDYAIIFLDKDGVIQNWNKGAQKIKQYEEWEAVGNHFRMFYLPEDRLGKLPEILLEQARMHGRAIHEGWRLRKDRTRFWGSITLTALHDQNNDLIGFSKVTRDLTEKKLADDQLRSFTNELQLRNEELRKSEERYHKMIAEVVDYAIILLDADGNILNWNMGAQNIKGYAAEEIIGKNFSVFYAEEDRLRQLPQHLLAEAAEKGKAVHEGWRVTKQGNRFWGSIVITALHDDNGSLIGYSKVTRDLTIKKQADDKLNEYLLELQRQNEELDQFAYTASHDLQEPLRKIRMFADLIEQNLDDKATAQKYLDKVNRASQRMLDMIHAVLEYSMLSKYVDQIIETDFNMVLGNVISDLELIIKQKKAIIESDKLPVINVNPLQANQLFTNLIGNALKYSNENPVIRISMAIVSEATKKHSTIKLPAGNYYELIFSDNGIGFEPEYANVIFSLFQRLHRKHEYTGTGIGLALCKKIMDNLEGYIYAEGKPGKGASFYLYFPIK